MIKENNQFGCPKATEVYAVKTEDYYSSIRFYIFGNNDQIGNTVQIIFRNGDILTIPTKLIKKNNYDK